MELVTAIGFTAGALTTVAFLPQLQRTWKMRSADDVSLAMLLTFTTGVLLWFVYGLLVQSWPIVVTNVVTFLLTAAILVLKLRFRP